MAKITTISQIIFKYESDFNGVLKSVYEDDKEFLKDLINTIKNDGMEDILEYYRTDLVSRNHTNSTQIKELKDIILILEGQV